MRIKHLNFFNFHEVLCIDRKICLEPFGERKFVLDLKPKILKCFFFK